MAKKKETEGQKEIRFLLSPTGLFGLGYNAGDTAFVDEAQAAEIVEAGYARYTDDAENAATTTVDVKALQAENADLKKTISEKDTEIQNLKTSLEVKTNAPDKETNVKNIKVNEAENATNKAATTAENNNGAPVPDLEK